MAAVEFALVAIVFFMLLIGIVEMGRVLFTWNAAAEATRYGARVAVVCDPGDKAAILSRMQQIMPSLTTDNVAVTYLPNSCNAASCQQVSVSIQGLLVSPLIPRPPQKDLPYKKTPWIFSVPPFTTTLPRESMLNEIDGHANPVCT
jgi:Flp pilus assembly protein TadG